MLFSVSPSGPAVLFSSQGALVWERCDGKGRDEAHSWAWGALEHEGCRLTPCLFFPFPGHQHRSRQGHWHCGHHRRGHRDWEDP